MAFIPVPDTAKATLQWSIAAQVVEITLGFLKTGGWNATTLGILAIDLLAWFTAELKPLLWTSSILQNINATDQSSVSGPSVDFPITSGGVGANGSTPTALNGTAAIKFNTLLRGRSYRGRNFIPTLPNNGLVSPVELSAAQTLAIVSAWANLNTYLGVSAADHVVISRYNAGAPRVTGVATPVISYGMDSSVDSQRRRLQGRGI